MDIIEATIELAELRQRTDLEPAQVELVAQEQPPGVEEQPTVQEQAIVVYVPPPQVQPEAVQAVNDQPVPAEPVAVQQHNQQPISVEAVAVQQENQQPVSTEPVIVQQENQQVAVAIPEQDQQAPVEQVQEVPVQPAQVQPPPPPPVQVEPPKPPPKVNCCVCYTSFEAEKKMEYGIVCQDGTHIYCMGLSCFGSVIDLALSGEEFQCPACKKPFNESNFSSLLNEEQKKAIDRIVWKQLERDQTIRCAFCGYFEHCESSDGIDVFHCRNGEECGKVTCLICYKEVKRKDDNFDWEEHIPCQELKDVKHEVQQTVERASTQRCPECGLDGRKDLNCTHITCVRCSGMFCYLCGMSAEAFNWDFCEHNEGWETDYSKCTQYLTNICDVDPDWPSDAAECLDYFHEKKIKIELKKLISKYVSNRQLDLLHEVERVFKVFSNIGLKITELMDEEVVLFKQS
eukprot:TRINITY_DN19469_c0_g1_i1.p1 TRINITY_DN19469_c0_g1~~TRINITY_DN19469_c0_g1_i1.p1  ORF type:complete len:458 (+),score=145.36 TRINITY_DN19469_c0_g1_i1:115-1488(+)